MNSPQNPLSDNDTRQAALDHTTQANQPGGWHNQASTPNPNPIPPLAPPSYHTISDRRRYYQQAARQDNWVWVIAGLSVLIFTLIVTIGIVVLVRLEDQAAKDDAVQSIVQQQPSQEPTSIIYSAIEPQDLPAEAINDDGEVRGALDGNSLEIVPWGGEERFTVLLMGMDNRPGQTTSGSCRTDTIMVISLDPINNSIGVLSIPRDTYVEIPGYRDLQRINTACTLGNLQQPGYGPILAMQAVQYNFGIRINDYVMIDFNAFIKIIDRIGGVDVLVEKTINDPTYPNMNYGYDPFYIEAGWQHLDGAAALKYARSRHTSDDIDRGRRQQQIVLAVRDKVLSVDMIPDLVINALPIWNDVNQGILTGLSLDQLIQLALFASEVPKENINNAVVNWECCLMSYTTPGGASVLIPNRWALGPLMIDVFGEGYNR